MNMQTLKKELGLFLLGLLGIFLVITTFDIDVFAAFNNDEEEYYENLVLKYFAEELNTSQEDILVNKSLTGMSVYDKNKEVIYTISFKDKKIENVKIFQRAKETIQLKPGEGIKHSNYSFDGFLNDKRISISRPQKIPGTVDKFESENRFFKIQKNQSIQLPDFDGEITITDFDSEKNTLTLFIEKDLKRQFE